MLTSISGFVEPGSTVRHLIVLASLALAIDPEYYWGARTSPR